MNYQLVSDTGSHQHFGGKSTDTTNSDNENIGSIKSIEIIASKHQFRTFTPIIHHIINKLSSRKLQLTKSYK